MQLMENRWKLCDGNPIIVQNVKWAARCWHREYKRVNKKYENKFLFCSETDRMMVIEALTSNHPRYKMKCSKDSNNCTRNYCKTRSKHTLLLEKIHTRSQINMDKYRENDEKYIVSSK